MSLSFLLVVCIHPFMLYACTLTPYQYLPLFVYSMQLLFLRDTNIKPSDHIFPCEPYLLIDNQCSWKDTFVATCVLLEHGLGQAWLSVTGEVVFQDKDCWSRAAKETALLFNSSFFFPILSFISGALANIRHPFLMHSHMVILFFLTGIVPNKYK